MKRNPVRQKALSLLLSIALVLGIFGVDTVGAFAAQNSSPTTLYLDSGSILITDSGYSVNGSPITAQGPQDSGYLITQNSSTAITNTVTVQSGTQDITLRNVHARPAGGAAFEVENLAEADITLEGSNSLDTSGSSSFRAGLSVNAGSTVHITGNGTLTATGGNGSAGIGGNSQQGCGTVEISGGSVTATGGGYGAGIGGGWNGAGGTITIRGGNVTATGGSNSVGIGGGWQGAGGTITISGGTVTATGIGGAGIGGGNSGSGGTITISGGTVMATGGIAGAGIGGGCGGSGGTINISGGTVTASGGTQGAGIGGGWNSAGGTITIRGGNVTATGGTQGVSIGGGAGIGGGYDGDSGTVTVSGPDTEVAAKGQDGGKDIGTGSPSGHKPISGGTLAVSDGATVAMLNSSSSLNTNASKDYKNCQIISGSTETTYVSGVASSTQPVLYLDDGSIAINSQGYSVNAGSVQSPPTGGYLILQRSSGTATQHTITVQNGTQNITIWNVNVDVSATNNACAFSIAAGAAVNLTLKGTNTLKSGMFCAGLQVPGDGSNPPAQNGNAFLTVTAQSTGSLDATGGLDSAGIGGGWARSGGSIQMKGGTVTATGGNCGAGIGGGGYGDGGYGDGGTVAISGPNTKVTAKGQDGGRDIGSGDGGSNGGTLTVGDGRTAAPLPVLELLLAGTNAANANNSRPQFMNCVIQGAGAKDASGSDISGLYDANGKKVITPVPPAPTPAPQNNSGGSLVPSPVPVSPLSSSVSDAATGAQIDLSGAVLPAGVTSVTLSVTQVARNSTADSQGANVFRSVLSDTKLNVIGTPFVYNIKLLDQSGNPVTFTGSVQVRLPLPAGLRGTPRVFRYEESSGTFTDMNAAVQNGFLVFTTTHFSYYAVAGTGDSITLDTTSYQMPVKGQYQIGMKLTGPKAATVKFYSTNSKTATVAKLKNGNYQVTGKSVGTVWVMFDVYDSKNRLLTHASTRVDVKTGIRPRGDSTRQIGVY